MYGSALQLRTPTFGLYLVRDGDMGQMIAKVQ